MFQLILFACASISLAEASWPGRYIPTIGTPSRIYRVRLRIIGTKMIMPQTYDDTQILDVYNLRLSWTDPAEWNDKRDSKNRKYEYACWVARGTESKVLTHRVIDSAYQGYAEPLRFPQNFDAQVQCKVRALNSLGYKSDWRYSHPVSIKEIPIYLPGLDVDLRGIPNKKILDILRARK